MKALFAVIAFIFVASGFVSSQQPPTVAWELTGPSDGGVTDIVEFPDGRLFAATEKGLYQSSDDGAHWARCSEALGDFVRVLKDGELLVGPTMMRQLSYVDGTCRTHDTVTLPSQFSAQPVFSALTRLSTGRLLASLWSLGLFVSDDDGRQWRQAALPPSPNGDRISSFVTMPSGHIVAASGGSLLRSSDDGDTWMRTGLGTSVRRLAVGSSGALFGVDNGVSRSLDEGTTWQKIAFDGLTTWAVIAIGTGMPGSNPSRLFAATQRPDRFDSLVSRSTDGGSTWTPTGSELTGRVNAFAHTSKGALIAGTSTGLFRSIDNGASWKFQGVSPAALHVIAADQTGLVITSRPGGWVNRQWS